MSAQAEQVAAPAEPCCLSVDQDGFAVCCVRRRLLNAVEGWSGAARAVKGQREREQAITRKNAAIRALVAHACDPVPVADTGRPRRGAGESDTTRTTVAGGISATAQPDETADTSAQPHLLTSIMADVATLVALGRRIGMADCKAEYDAAYAALESKIERALQPTRRPLEHYLPAGEEPRG